ncbi:ATP synthase F1 subunit delta [Aeoliella mucimassa]|uniref:ATP synthase subunit delta n=1 Tax=Aeoliella mucimassa TaxID=2527972 RepID=A0A518ANS9_9BACT|nr:ATP synthase F1 subunit delta [Aeoliella mucimassa]QDU56374.1 ATP synthase subunit delta [Aeoliella mucimassa]
MSSPYSTNIESAEAIVDVGQEQLARTYAKAFLSATESMDQAALVEELDSLVTDVLKKFPEFNYHLTSDFLSHDERVKLIDGVLGGRASAPVVNLLKTLSQNHRNGSLHTVLHAIHKLYGETIGRHEVRVYVPQALDAKQQADLSEVLKNRFGMEAEFHVHIDPSLIGGLIVQIGDTVFDGSVRTTLERARHHMLEHAIEAIETNPQRFAAD